MIWFLYASFMLNILFVLFWVFSWLKDPHPPMPNDRLLFLRRKAEKFRQLEYHEINELFNVISKYGAGKKEAE